jgi:hypothetical protein
MCSESFTKKEMGAQLNTRSMELETEKIVKEVDKDSKEHRFYYAARKQKQPQSFCDSADDDATVTDCAQRRLLAYQRHVKHSIRLYRESQRKLLEEMHRTMARSGAPALLASAHIPSERVEESDEVSNFRNLRRRAKTNTNGRHCQVGKCGRTDHRDDCLRSGSIVVKILLAIVANISTQVRSMLVSASKAAAVIGNAIGARRYGAGRGAEDDGQEAEQDMPLVMVWLINLMIFCGFVIIYQSVLAFSIQDGASNEGIGLGSSVLGAIRLSGRVRLILLASLSFVAGMGLWPIDPLQSALLLGV